MARFVYNAAKAGLFKGEIDLDGDTFKVLLLEASGDQDKDDADVAAVLARAGTTELTSTGYVRRTLTGLVVTQDDTNDDAEWTADNVEWDPITQLAAEVVVGFFIYKFVTNDSDSIPILINDDTTNLTPDGNYIVADWPTIGILAEF